MERYPKYFSKNIPRCKECGGCEYRESKCFSGSYEYPNKKMRQPDEKEQINKFLGEILSLCIEKGLGSFRFLNNNFGRFIAISSLLPAWYLALKGFFFVGLSYDSAL
ncbi:MAG: hypothetical protein Ct9H90mP27_3160 [Gammaproteobacteria bacterium]|nr:MAG: hypothetical protein Ct9H90mP27_3160 [Gammaproteobacteria bacterium]